MQISEEEQQSLNQLKSLLEEDYLSTDQKTDLLAESMMSMYNRWIKNDYCDVEKSEKVYYLYRHLVQILRCLDQLKDSHLCK